MAAVEQQGKVEEEVEQLKRDIVRLGSGNADGKYFVKFGVLFSDPVVEQYYEALLGTLKAAKKRGVIDFTGQMLLKGAHDNVDVTLLIPPEGASAPPPPEVEASAAAAAPTKPKFTPSPAADVRSKSPPRSTGGGGGGAARSLGEMLTPPTTNTPQMAAKFEEVNGLDADAMCQYFLKSFIFALKDDWKDVPLLLKEFRKQCKDTGDGTGPPDTMNHIQASDFLQKHGKTRTAAERKGELNDVDINNDGRISFLEYLLLHYKVMILTEFYKRYELSPLEDLSNDGIGVMNVGHKLVDEVLTLPAGLNPAIEAAIEEFMTTKKAREQKIKDLTAKAEAGGVKGMAAKQELTILENAGDETELNRIELTLQAAKRKASKNRGDVVLADLAAKEAAAVALAKAEAKARMDAKRAMFEGGKK